MSRMTWHIRLRLAPAQGEEVDRIASRLGMSRSEYIRSAIDNKLAIDTPTKGK